MKDGNISEFRPTLCKKYIRIEKEGGSEANKRPTELAFWALSKGAIHL